MDYLHKRTYLAQNTVKQLAGTGLIWACDEEKHKIHEKTWMEKGKEETIICSISISTSVTAQYHKRTIDLAPFRTCCETEA